MGIIEKIKNVKKGVELEMGKTYRRILHQRTKEIIKKAKKRNKKETGVYSISREKLDIILQLESRSVKKEMKKKLKYIIWGVITGGLLITNPQLVDSNNTKEQQSVDKNFSLDKNFKKDLKIKLNENNLETTEATTARVETTSDNIKNIGLVKDNNKDYNKTENLIVLENSQMNESGIRQEVEIDNLKTSKDILNYIKELYIKEYNETNNKNLTKENVTFYKTRQLQGLDYNEEKKVVIRKKGELNSNISCYSNGCIKIRIQDLDYEGKEVIKIYEIVGKNGRF